MWPYIKIFSTLISRLCEYVPGRIHFVSDGIQNLKQFPLSVSKMNTKEFTGNHTMPQIQHVTNNFILTNQHNDYKMGKITVRLIKMLNQKEIILIKLMKATGMN